MFHVSGLKDLKGLKGLKSLKSSLFTFSCRPTFYVFVVSRIKSV